MCFGFCVHFFLSDPRPTTTDSCYFLLVAPFAIHHLRPCGGVVRFEHFGTFCLSMEMRGLVLVCPSFGGSAAALALSLPQQERVPESHPVLVSAEETFPGYRDPHPPIEFKLLPDDAVIPPAFHTYQHFVQDRIEDLFDRIGNVVRPHRFF